MNSFDSFFLFFPTNLLIVPSWFFLELPDTVVKGLVRTSVINCFNRFNQKQSFNNTFKLLEALFKKKMLWTMKCLMETFISVFFFPNSSISYVCFFIYLFIIHLSYLYHSLSFIFHYLFFILLFIYFFNIYLLI